MSCLACRNCGFVNIFPEPQPQNVTALHSSDDSIVLQILRGSRSLLDADHTSIDSEIAKLERLWNLYDEQLEKIQALRGPVLKSLENHLSVYAPIRRLPRDVLIEIFHLVYASSNLGRGTYPALGARIHDSLDLSGPLWDLGRVCGLWRDTLHTSPASWARDVLLKSPFSKHAPEILQTYLEHTGEHPLNLMVSCHGPDSDARASEIMSLAVQSSYRWKNVCIFTHINHLHYLYSISNIPILQTIWLDILEGRNFDYRLDMCLNAPQLWRACFSCQGIRRVRLPPSITHYSGCITGVEDFQLLSHLPKLRTCSLRPFRMSSAKLRVGAAVIMPELLHLFVDCANFVNFITAPLLQHLTVSLSPGESACITSFLQRSGCHLESFSCVESPSVLYSDSSALIGNMLSSEACSTISRLKIQLDPQFSQFIGALSLPSVLPNLRHLILCIITPAEKDEWSPVLDMIRSRCDVGSIKTVELQFAGGEYISTHGYDIIAETRALVGDRPEMRIEAWNSPVMENRARFHGSNVIG